MEDMPWGLRAFAHYICLALDNWGYEFDGSKVNKAIDTMLGEMTEEEIKDLVDFVDEVNEKIDEDTQEINYELVGFYLEKSKYALGFVMLVSDEYAVEHFNYQLEDMNND